MTPNKPSNKMLQLNLSEIRNLEYALLTIKRQAIKGTVSHKCYQSVKSNVSGCLNKLYFERRKLLSTYKTLLDVYHKDKQTQVLLSYNLKIQKFEKLKTTISKEDCKLLKEFQHML